MEEVFKELWLHSVCDFDPGYVDAVLKMFETAENVYGTVVRNGELIKNSNLPKRFIREAFRDNHKRKVDRIQEYCSRNGIRILTMDSEEYCEGLKNVEIPPRILFAVGKKMNFQDNVGISVVGSRKCTIQGKNYAEELGFELAKNGITVISGMAEGIDSAAQYGAVKAGGRTIAVLAGGVDDIYPRSSKNLYNKILECGTVISERPPSTRVRQYFYQQRNRLMVGLADGVIIVEGKKQSGTAITARLAADNNRDVFAVPGHPTSISSELPNALIAEGAMVMESLRVPVDYYKDRYPEKIKEAKTKVTENKSKILQLTDEDEVILNVLREHSNVATVDLITQKSKLEASKVGARLTILCVKGIIKQESGSRVILIHDVNRKDD